MNDHLATDKARKPRRDRERTRTAILEVAAKVLAQEGPEGLSVSQVAQRVGVNRGTAYHHFETREQLLKETTAWISEQLCREVFGESVDAGDQAVVDTAIDPRELSERLCRFTMDNPEFGRAWLFEVLSSSEPADDPFWRLYRAHIEQFAGSDLAQPGIDAEVHAMLMLVGVFMWPVWTRAHEQSPKTRRKLARRFAGETLRLGLHGALRRERFPSLGRLRAEAEADEDSDDSLP